MKKDILIIILSIVSLSCVKMPNETTEQKNRISVIGIIYSNVDKQKIYLYHTADIKEKGNYKFVDNAQVTVYNDQQNINFNYESVPTYPNSYFLGEYYINSSATSSIFPDIKYYLNIKIKNGGSLTGVTTVPGKFNIISPAAGMILDEGSALNLSIKWHKCKNAYGYIINILGSYIIETTSEPFEYSRYYFRSCYSYSTTDTTYTIHEEKVTLKKDTYTIKVMAYDRNFYDHYILGIDKSGVDGGYGVFASAALDSVNFLVE